MVPSGSRRDTSRRTKRHVKQNVDFYRVKSITCDGQPRLRSTRIRHGEGAIAMMSGRDVTRLSSLTFVAPAHRPLPLPGSAPSCRTGPLTTGNYPWRLASELTAQKKSCSDGPHYAPCQSSIRCRLDESGFEAELASAGSAHSRTERAATPFHLLSGGGLHLLGSGHFLLNELAHLV